LAAGADIALMPPDSSAAQKAIVAAMGDGTLEKDDLVEKSERVVAMQLATADAQKAVQSDGESGNSTDSDEDQQKVLTEVAEKRSEERRVGKECRWQCLGEEARGKGGAGESGDRRDGAGGRGGGGVGGRPR